MVVASPSFFSVGKPITEFGAIRIVSSPRTSSTRPLWPVRMVSPGFSASSCVSATCSTPVVVIQTSPEDLPTDQTPSSAADAAETPPRISAVARTVHKLFTRIKHLTVREHRASRECFKIELVGAPSARQPR